MKISCPACAAKYSIADEKVQDRLAKIRCRKCGTTIVIDGKVSPPAITTSSGADAAEPHVSSPTEVGLGAPGAAVGGGAAGGVGPGEYSVDLGDNDQRNMNVAQLSTAMAQGTVSEDTYVWADGMADWQRIGDIPNLMAQLGPRRAPSSPKIPATPASPDPFTPRAATAQERSGAHDLFGGIESAGGEEDVTTSAPEPTPLAPAHAAAPAATGARNESSVLFSLSALTAGRPAPAAAAPAASPLAQTMAAPTPPPAMMSRSTASREDSGLIDLKALSTAVNAPGGSDVLTGGVSPLGLGPPVIGMAPLGGPLGGVVHAVPAADDLDIARGRGSKGPMIIGAAILVVGLAAVGVFAMKGTDETAGSPTPAADTSLGAKPSSTPRDPVGGVAAASAAAKEEPKGEEPTAAPPPTGTAAPAEAPKKPTSSTASRPAPTKRPSAPAAAAPKPEPAPAPAPAPAAKPAPAKPKKCNCKPSDLLCAMKCSTK